MSVRSDDVWVLVIDATRARILRGIGETGQPLMPELVLKAESRHLRDIMSDSGQRDAKRGEPGKEEATDPLLEDERQFLRGVVAVLESHRMANEIHRLAVFGDLRSLAMLHAILPSTLGRLLLAEMPLDLVNVSPQDLPHVVRDHLASRT
ncbi:host attachment protein [Cereibacter sphaeroides]|uniref:host attachment protein n=1 Tax=Cereibacter sphaeroides TaxID=1063 RepID=UPI001F23ABDC|nr:host attachment protein [Cereibacter sphaeroides]MCE6951331.1 host attachment protein [Cereibacter sphaeroides]